MTIDPSRRRAGTDSACAKSPSTLFETGGRSWPCQRLSIGAFSAPEGTSVRPRVPFPPTRSQCLSRNFFCWTTTPYLPDPLGVRGVNFNYHGYATTPQKICSRSARWLWVGQVSRDIGVKFTTRTWTLTTHAIDAGIDDSRDNVFGDLIGTDRLGAVAYLPGVGASDPEDPPQNLTGDTHHTDGLRLVAWLRDDGAEGTDFVWFEHDESDAYEPP
jgi:hypothetical protein